MFIGRIIVFANAIEYHPLISGHTTGKQESRRTKDRPEAKRLLNARNEACRQPVINMQIASTYLFVGDPDFPECLRFYAGSRA